MKVTYDPQADALHIRFREVPVGESDEDKSGLILDYDPDGTAVGTEIRDAPEGGPDPRDERSLQENPPMANISSPGFLHAKAWAEAYELIDLQLSPLGLRAIEALGLSSGNIVVDVGCGTGQTLLQLAERVGTEGQVIGVDMAPLLLEVAKRRTVLVSQMRLIEADAQTLDLPSESVDAVFSRFGVMTFIDPVAAFTNFHRILKPLGALAFSCWRSLEENELDHLPLSAAGFRLTSDSSPFSFADPEHIRRTLEAAGFSEIIIRSHEEKVSSGDLDAMTGVLLKVGPLGKIVREHPALRATAKPLLRKALAALGDPSRVQLLASAWIVTARTGVAAG